IQGDGNPVPDRRRFRPVLEYLEDRSLPATFTVTNVNDNGADSLRWAIDQANLTATLDTIDFNIPGAGPHTILVTSQLPTITSPVVIDGYTEPGALRATASSPATLRIVLREAAGTQVTYGLNITAGDSTVRGLVIGEFDTGISLDVHGNNWIEGSYIGT